MNGDHDRRSESHAASSNSTISERTLVRGDDLLSDVLETVRLRAALLFLWEPGMPFAVTVPDGMHLAPMLEPKARQVLSYHIVLEGPCWGAVSGHDPVRLNTGDILLLPHGDAYVIASRPQQPDPGVSEEIVEFFHELSSGRLPPVVRDGGAGEPRNRLVCGFLVSDLLPFNPLLCMVPPLLVVRASQGSDSRLSALLDMALQEVRGGYGGTRCMLSRLCELMFVEAIRRYWISIPRDDAGWLQGIRDPVIGKALYRMHGDVAHHWTLGSLARAIGTSRSTLAERFAHVIGESPMQYLTRWRMQLAALSLSHSHAKILSVARDAGYTSEAAFSRAFKRHVGVSPAQWRSRALTDGGTQMRRTGRAGS